METMSQLGYCPHPVTIPDIRFVVGTCECLTKFPYMTFAVWGQKLSHISPSDKTSEARPAAFANMARSARLVTITPVPYLLSILEGILATNLSNKDRRVT